MTNKLIFLHIYFKHNIQQIKALNNVYIYLPSNPSPSSCGSACHSHHPIQPGHTALWREEKCTEFFSCFICIPASSVATHVSGILEMFPSLFCLLQQTLIFHCVKEVVVQDAHSHNNSIHILWCHCDACIENSPSCCQNAKGAFHHHSGPGQSVVEYLLPPTKALPREWPHQVPLQREGRISHHGVWYWPFLDGSL